MSQTKGRAIINKENKQNNTMTFDEFWISDDGFVKVTIVLHVQQQEPDIES